MNEFAAIFDLDGTITNTPLLFRENTRRFCHERFGLENALEFLKGKLGLSLPALAEQLATYVLEHTGQKISPQQLCGDLQEYVNRKEPVMFQQALHDGYGVVPGFLPLAKDLQQGGIPMAIATMTTKERALRLLHQAGLASFFPENRVVSVNDVLVHERKPHPQCFYLAAESMAIPLSRVVVVGDSKEDMRGGCAAQAPVRIGRAYRFGMSEQELRTEGANYVVEDYRSMNARKIRHLLALNRE